MQGEKLWGIYGFYDAFNLDQNWFADSYLAIDQGPIVAMIENYRTELLWNNFMQNPEIEPALFAMGFQPDNSDLKEQGLQAETFKATVFPNPANLKSRTVLELELSEPQQLAISLISVSGQNIRNIRSMQDFYPGKQTIALELQSLPAGSYFINLLSPNGHSTNIPPLPFYHNTYTTN